MYTLSSYLQYSYNTNQEKGYLLEEVNSYKKKISKYLSGTNSYYTTPLNKPPSCYTEFVKYLFIIYTTDLDNIDSFSKEVSRIIDSPIELLEIFIPQLVGFYILNCEFNQKASSILLETLFKISKKSKKISHLIFWNLLSSKDSYKRFSSLQSIKSLIIDFMDNWEYDDNYNLKNPKGLIIYESIFQEYSSFEEFVNKNLIVFNNLKSDLYIIDDKVNFKELYPNKKHSNNNIDDNKKPICIETNQNIVNGNPTEQFKWKDFTSTLNFINDLITISESLRTTGIENRNKVLLSFIKFYNSKLLPSNVYIPLPIGPESLNFYSSHSDGQVLQICEDYAYCLSTKEKVPFHILIEMADSSGIYPKAEPLISEYKPMENYNINFDIESSLFNICERNENKNKSSTPRKKNFFSSFFHCCGTADRVESEDEDEEKEKNKSQSKEMGLFGNLTYNEVSKKILDKSKFNNGSKYFNRKLISIIVKGGEDMRQDQFVSQVIEIFICIFDKENLDIFLKPLNIITNGRGGVIQTFTNVVSLQKIKSFNFDFIIEQIDKSKNNASYLSYLGFSSNESNFIPNTNNLKNYFIYKFGNNTDKYYLAVNNFMKSFVGYSLLCYFLEVKDRNNGNILIDDEGYMIHIDFGFLLSHSPGNMNFEKAPFKFTIEFLDLLQGVDSKLFASYKQLFFEGFILLRKNWSMILSFIDIYIMSNSDLPCFYNAEFISDNIKKKFLLDLTVNNSQSENEIIRECTDSIIFNALNNWRTNLYDNFQKYCVGVN